MTRRNDFTVVEDSLTNSHRIYLLPTAIGELRPEISLRYLMHQRAKGTGISERLFAILAGQRGWGIWAGYRLSVYYRRLETKMEPGVIAIFSWVEVRRSCEVAGV